MDFFTKDGWITSRDYEWRYNRDKRVVEIRPAAWAPDPEAPFPENASGSYLLQ
jgi:hypothetical protein